jgi:hypothetical protein
MSSNQALYLCLIATAILFAICIVGYNVNQLKAEISDNANSMFAISLCMGPYDADFKDRVETCPFHNTRNLPTPSK